MPRVYFPKCGPTQDFHLEVVNPKQYLDFVGKSKFSFELSFGGRPNSIQDDRPIPIYVGVPMDHGAMKKKLANY